MTASWASPNRLRAAFSLRPWSTWHSWQVQRGSLFNSLLMKPQLEQVLLEGNDRAASTTSVPGQSELYFIWCSSLPMGAYRTAFAWKRSLSMPVTLRDFDGWYLVLADE